MPEQSTLWPARPTCHDNDYASKTFGAASWQVRDGLRRCSFCGSLHPEDLYSALTNGAKLEASDWKYGWPHKFYVNGIPNPNVGNEVSKAFGSGPLPMTEENKAHWNRIASTHGGRVEITESEGRWNAKVYEPDGATTWGKWYNVHLMELSQEAFDLLAPLLNAGTGVKFERTLAGDVSYRASAPEPWLARGKQEPSNG